MTVTQPGTSTTPTTTGPTTTGPDKSTGTTPGAPPAKKKKTGTQHRHAAHARQRAADHLDPEPDHHHEHDPDHHDPDHPTPRPAPPAAAHRDPQDHRAPDRGRPRHARGHASTHHKAPAPPPTAQPRAGHRPPSGALVHGELISDVVPLPANQSPLVHLVSATTGSAPARQAPERRSVLAHHRRGTGGLRAAGPRAQRELGATRGGGTSLVARTAPRLRVRSWHHRRTRDDHLRPDQPRHRRGDLPRRLARSRCRC